MGFLMAGVAHYLCNVPAAPPPHERQGSAAKMLLLHSKDNMQQNITGKVKELTN